jgi:membrane fusion protein, copper/silver efflux system
VAADTPPTPGSSAPGATEPPALDQAPAPAPPAPPEPPEPPAPPTPPGGPSDLPHGEEHHPEGEEPPPRGVAMMAVVRWAILLAVATVALLSFWFLLAPKPHGNIRYTCPMVEHSFVVTDEPGECPICHMVLMPMDAQLIEARRSAGAAEAASAAADGGRVPGVMPIALHLDRVQKIGVRTALALEADADATVRAPAYVAAPDQGESQVHVRSSGFVEKIAVGQTGVSVRAGQPLFYMYSPEIYRAQEELLATRRFSDNDAGALLDSGPTVDAARRRLELLGLTRADTDALIKRDAPARTIAVRAPAAGYVVRKEVSLGAYVSPEMTLYELVDLSRVYVLADVFTRDLAALKVGSAGLVHFASAGLDVEGKIDLIYPELNTQARTARVRLSVSNKKRLLRPGMYGEASFPTAPRRVLTVPRDAVIDTGTAAYVFIDEGEGHFSPRAVVLGAEATDRVEILDGLRAGERVVSGATFLIDSESRLQASLAGLAGPSGAAGAAGAAQVPSGNGPARPHGPGDVHAETGAIPRGNTPPLPPAGAPSGRGGPGSPAAPAAPGPAPGQAGASAASPSGGAAAPAPLYTCPMHPQVQSPSPGQCPICGMDLVPARR